MRATERLELRREGYSRDKEIAPHAPGVGNEEDSRAATKDLAARKLLGHRFRLCEVGGQYVKRVPGQGCRHYLAQSSRQRTSDLLPDRWARSQAGPMAVSG